MFQLGQKGSEKLTVGRAGWLGQLHGPLSSAGPAQRPMCGKEEGGVGQQRGLEGGLGHRV